MPDALNQGEGVLDESEDSSQHWGVDVASDCSYRSCSAGVGERNGRCEVIAASHTC
jgi:hypothetical protein